MTKPIKTIGQEFLDAVAKDDEWYKRVLDEAGYGLPDSDKPKVQPQQKPEITGGILGHLTQQSQQPKQPIDNIFDALRAMADKQ
jgi:hypothetical protein